jgi:predicted Rossmann-fold nucleotide-binding protein
VLTLAQTHKLAKKITVVIYGSEYWKKVFNLDALVDTGAISPKDIELFQFADTPEAAFEMLKNGLTENYLAPEAAIRGESHRTENHADEEPPQGPLVKEILGPELAKIIK